MSRSKPPVEVTRRQMLLRLGLAAGTAYSAPVLLGLCGARASTPSGSSLSDARPVRRARPEIVVSAPSASDIDRIAAQGYSVIARSRLGLLDAELARLRLPAGMTVQRARAQIRQIVPAALFDLNHIYRPGELSCGADSCAAFDMIGWKMAAHSCPAGTTVGMIDTAVNLKHPALRGVNVEMIQSVTAGRRVASSAHGTAIAVLIAGRRDAITPGLLHGVRLIAASAFHRDARGRDAADAFDLARAVDALAVRDAGVINMSFAGPANEVLQRVVEAARARDIILVAAAGNAGSRSEPLYPAAYDGVVAVTAVDRYSRVYRQANAGAHVDFAAPGVRLWTAGSGTSGQFRSGTSYAAPFVSAAFATARARDPKKNVAELIEAMAGRAADLGPPGRDATYGWGLVRADADCRGEGAGLVRPAGSGRG